MNFWTATLEELYQELCRTPSDINQLLPTLRHYAEQCRHITEFGVRTANSTCALLAAQPDTLIGYDTKHHIPYIENLTRVKGKTRCVWPEQNVLQVVIEPTDFLFIDTDHTYVQLREELRLHADKVKKYIGLHDTDLFGFIDCPATTNPVQGLRPAINEFLAANTQWQIVEDIHASCGLVVMERQHQPVD